MNNLRQDFLKQSIATIENLTARLQNETETLSEKMSRDLFRALHTIKGTSQAFGFPASSRLAHELETLLSAVKNQSIPARENYKTLFLEGFQCLKKSFEKKDSAAAAAFIEKLQAIVPRENQENLQISQSEIPDAILSQLSKQENAAVNSALKIGKNIACLEIGFDLANFADELPNFRETLADKCEIIAALPSAKFNSGGKIGFQFLIAAPENIEEIEKIIENASAEIIFRSAPKEFSNDLQGVAEQVAAHGKSLARELGKEVGFEISVGKTAISPSSLKIVFDLLLHLVRNAVDHAIESRDERIAENKTRRGTIKINFSESENNFYLTVADDGRGIDAKKIRAKALEKNLIANGENLSEQASLDLIFKPEFSTAEKLTNISGRGIGLDAVKDAIEKIGGKVSVKSRKKTGTTFEIFLPKRFI